MGEGHVPWVWQIVLGTWQLQEAAIWESPHPLERSGDSAKAQYCILVIPGIDLVI